MTRILPFVLAASALIALAIPAGAGGNSHPPAGLELAAAANRQTCDISKWTSAWDTEYGPMRTRLNGNRVEGDYDYNDGHLSGTLDDSGCVFTGTWEQSIPSTRGPDFDRGRMVFVLAKDGRSWRGTYDYAGSPEMRDGWNGTRAGGIGI